MTLKTGILAAAAALALAVPAAALAQPYYDHGGYRARGYDGYERGWVRHDDWRWRAPAPRYDGWRRDHWDHDRGGYGRAYGYGWR
jgi:hypothetical protein